MQTAILQLPYFVGLFVRTRLGIGRHFSACVGLAPKQSSSGSKDKLGSISKQGDRYLRSLYTAGALAVIRYAKFHGTDHRPWLTRLLARRPTGHRACQQARQDGLDCSPSALLRQIEGFSGRRISGSS
ncbi:MULTISPECIES: transposase [Bradyrhizobium]|uniref:transposase n=1 Tax=Bradyrhizobium frederickii TaxID=2560054 RepID=UPI0013DFCFAD